MQNELTVAICAYNCEKYIEETLSCILNQTFQGFDLLIVNDCSTDNSRNIINSFFRRTSRQFNLVDFTENKGLAEGRYFVENYVKTKYLLFIDADDCPYPLFVEKLYNKISGDEDLIAVGCYLEFIDSNGDKVYGGQFIGDKTKDEFYSRAIKNKLIFLASNAVFNREVAISVGSRAIVGFFKGEPRYQDLCEDLDLWTRMSDLYIYNKAIVVVPEVLFKYRKHDNGLSASSYNMVLRIRHVKTNLLLRRSGKKEITFIDFYNSLSNSEFDGIRRKSKAADSLRNGIFLFKRRKIFSAINYLLQSIWIDPNYICQKIKSNSGLLK